jgi:hypothetical protein
MSDNIFFVFFQMGSACIKSSDAKVVPATTNSGQVKRSLFIVLKLIMKMTFGMYGLQYLGTVMRNRTKDNKVYI